VAFTRALYYPWIDIKDEGWLKNAMLYWEKLQTIVPESIHNPYSTRTAREFQDEGLLIPFIVNPSTKEVARLTDDVLRYLESPEGAEVLISKEVLSHRDIHTDKVTKDVIELFDIHLDKLAHEIRHRIRHYLTGAKKNSWISVDVRFANFYMTLLATHISENIGASLLTDAASNDKLATAVKLDSTLSIFRSRRYVSDRYGHTQDMPRSLAQGALADLVFERIQIAPDTPVKKILKFRKTYRDELGRLRVKIDELTKTISNEQPLDALRQQVEDVYINEVTPATNSLKKGLTDSMIEWVAQNFLKVAFFSTASTSIPLALLGLSVPQALLVGAGVSLTTSAVLYNRRRAQMLRQNPFSYVLLATARLRHSGLLRSRPRWRA